MDGCLPLLGWLILDLLLLDFPVDLCWCGHSRNFALDVIGFSSDKAYKFSYVLMFSVFSSHDWLSDGRRVVTTRV